MLNVTSIGNLQAYCRFSWIMDCTTSVIRCLHSYRVWGVGGFKLSLSLTPKKKKSHGVKSDDHGCQRIKGKPSFLNGQIISWHL